MLRVYWFNILKTSTKETLLVGNYGSQDILSLYMYSLGGLLSSGSFQNNLEDSYDWECQSSKSLVWELRCEN